MPSKRKKAQATGHGGEFVVPPKPLDQVKGR